MIDREKLQQKLREQITKTQDKIVSYEAMSGPVAPDDAIGRVSRMDAINNQSVVEAALRTARNKLIKLEEMERNFDRIEPGACKRCGREIPVARVMLMPESPYCVRCA